MPPDPHADPQARRIAARRHTYKGLAFGTTLICVGAVLLLNTMGRVGWGVWFDLLRLWPLLLISIGLRSIFVPTRLHPLALAGPLLIVAGTVLTVTIYRDRVEAGLEDLERGRAVGIVCPGPVRGVPVRLHLTTSAGRIGIIGEAAPDQPEGAPAGSGAGLGGTLRYAGAEPSWACSNEGDMWLGVEGPEAGLRVMVPFGSRRALWDATLSSSHRVVVRGDLVASAAALDLRGFDLDRVDLDLAATSATLRLGTPRRPVSVHLDGAAADVDIRVPPGTCFTITRERVLSVLRGDALPPGSRRARRLTSRACPDGTPAEAPRYDFRFELPLSTVEVDADGGA